MTPGRSGFAGALAGLGGGEKGRQPIPSKLSFRGNFTLMDQVTRSL